MLSDLLFWNLYTAQSYSAKLLAYNPDLYLVLDETSGTNMADSSGNGLDGTASNLTLADAESPPGTDCPSFNGSSSRIVVPHNPLLMPTAITVALWMRLSDYSGAFRIILMKNDDGNWLSGYGFHVAGGSSLRFWVNNYLNFAGIAMPGTDWLHAGATYDGANIKFYLNGALVNTKATTAGINANAGNFTLGSDPSPGYWIQGNMAHVFLKGEVLNDAAMLDIATP
jgi:hypothetical protein